METKKSSFHYAWIIAFISCLMMFTSSGIISSAFTAVKPYLIEAYNLNQSQGGLLTTIRQISNIATIIIAVPVFKKLSLRWGCALGLLFSAIGFVFLGIGHTFIEAAVGMVFLGLTRTFAGMIGISMLINSWFKKYRNTLFGLASATSGFSTWIMPPLLSKWIEGSGFSYCCFIVTAILGVFTVLTALALRDTPEKMNMAALGSDEEFVEKKKASRLTSHNYQVGKKEHIMMLIVAFLSSMCFVHGDINGVNLVTAGWEKSVTATAVSYYGIFLLIGKFLYGLIADYLPMRKASIIYYVGMALSFFILGSANQPWFNMGILVVGYALYCLGGALCTNGLSTFALDMSPSKEAYGKTVQTYTLLYNLGGAGLAWVAGMVADATGGYSVVYFSMLAMAAAGLILVQIAYASAAKNYKKLHEGDAVAQAE